MIAHLITAGSGLRILVATGIPVIAGLRAWFSYRTTVIKERGRNRRLDTAIGGTAPDQRPEILRAIGELEGVASQARTGSPVPADLQDTAVRVRTTRHPHPTDPEPPR